MAADAGHCPLCGKALTVYEDTGARDCWHCGTEAELRVRAIGVQFTAGYHVGWRVWVRATTHGRGAHGLLSSLLLSMNGGKWQPYERHEAVCPEGNVPPCWGCCSGIGEGCGIYAVKQYGDLLVSGRNDLVVGQVALWGRVWEHEDERHSGWRGQYAYPLVFIDSVSSAGADQGLADAWGVPYLPLIQVLEQGL